MALKNGKPNPLNYFDLRRVDFAAPHFKYVILEKYTPNYIKIIDDWINKNLNNRYYLGQFLMLDPTAATACRFINGYTGDSTEMTNSIGTICETLTTSSVISDTADAITTAASTTMKAISSVAATVAQGCRYGKVIVNPFAVYLTEYDQTAFPPELM